MPTNYPGNIDNYSVKIDGVDTVAASHDNGDITDRYDYSAFGTLQSHTGSDSNRIMFSSEPNDEDSGLIYLRHRYYEPESGRFVSRDAIGIFGINKYIYCDNHTLGWIDPSGCSARQVVEAFPLLINKTKTEMKWSGEVCTLVPQFISPGLYNRVKNAVRRNDRFSSNKFFELEPGILYFKTMFSGKIANIVTGIKAYSKPVEKIDLRTGDFAFWGDGHIGVVISNLGPWGTTDMNAEMKQNIDKKFQEGVYNKFERFYVLQYSDNRSRIVLDPGSEHKLVFGRDPGLGPQDP